MALVLTLKEGQGFRLGKKLFTVGDIYSGQDFLLFTDGELPYRISSSQWIPIIEREAWARASDTRRLGGKEVGVMIDAPGYRAEREG